MARKSGNRSWASRVDANQAEIVECLRAIPGCEVRSMAAMGAGFPDIAVGFHNRNWFFEIKMPGKKLNDDQQKFFKAWTGQVQKVETVQEIILTITGMG